MDEDNDGRFPDDSPVEVRYPRTRQERLGDRSEWPWLLPGVVQTVQVHRCGNPINSRPAVMEPRLVTEVPADSDLRP